MEGRGPGVIIQPLTRLGQQGLDVLPAPLGPITDDAAAPLLFRHPAGLFALLEGGAALLVVLDLMPTEHMDDARAIPQREAQALGLAPLAPPPGSPSPRAPAPLAGLPGTIGTGRPLGPIQAQPQDGTAKAPGRHRGDASRALLARRGHVQPG